VIYEERNRVLDGKDIHDRVEEMMSDVIASNVLVLCPERSYSEEWDWDGLALWYHELTNLEGVVEGFRGQVDNPHELAQALADVALEAYHARKPRSAPRTCAT
jgi:preprotein translocase subunit SecA